jgi:penicillin-binding protein 2
MVVNGGKIYKPHVLKEVRDPVTNAVESVTEYEIIHQSYVSPSAYEAVRQDMRAVVSQGTAQWPLNISTVQIAGKSGTAEIGASDRWHSWFTSYGPFNSTNPDEQIVVTVFIEATPIQYTSASTATAIIYQGYFANQDYNAAVRALNFWDRM